MVLQYIRESLDGLTDGEKQHYQEKDGKFYLDIDDKNDDRVQGLIRNKNEALAEKEKLQKRVKELENSNGGEELERAKSRVAELETQLKEAGKSGKYSEEQVQQIKNDIENEYKTKLEEKDQALKSVNDRIATAQRESAIRDALTEAGVKKGAVAMMTAYLKDRVDVVEGDTGVFSVRIKKEDGSGHEVSTKDGSVFKSVGELVEEIKSKPDYGFAFEGSKASGGGAEANVNTGEGPSGGTGTFSNIKARADLKSHKDKAAFLEHLKEKHGGDEGKAQAEYFDLPEERPEA